MIVVIQALSQSCTNETNESQCLRDSLVPTLGTISDSQSLQSLAIPLCRAILHSSGLHTVSYPLCKLRPNGVPRGIPMAKPIKRPNGMWGVQIKVGDVRDSATFPTKRECDEWQARRKLELTSEAQGTTGQIKTLREALERYRDEVSPTHDGARWETLRINAFLRSEFLQLTLPLSKLQPDHLIRWRDERLTNVAKSTVLREMNLLGSILSHCVKEWRWIKTNPIREVTRPSAPKHRERTITPYEIWKMLKGLGYRPGKTPTSMTAMVGYAFVISLRTGMRDSEINTLTWDRVFDSWVVLPKTKNGDARHVPLSRKTRKYFQCLRGIDPERVFIFNTSVRDTLFRRARDRLHLEGFTFHDARHTAATWIGATVGQPGKLSFPEFVKVFGWRDPKFAMVYVNPTAASLAEKM